MNDHIWTSKLAAAPMLVNMGAISYNYILSYMIFDVDIDVDVDVDV